MANHAPSGRPAADGHEPVAANLAHADSLEGMPHEGTAAAAGHHGPEPSVLGMDATMWVSLAMLILILAVGKTVWKMLTGGLDNQIAAIRSRMSEMTAAQGYQDLTGQIIRRVVELVRAVHAGLGEITDGEATPIHLNNNRGFGPSVAGVDPTPATQEDANDLLSSLGL